MTAGIGLNILLAPISSETSFVVEEYAQKFPGATGSSKPSPQAYPLLIGELAGGQFFEPALSGPVYHKIN